ncbi:MAG: DUF134 domain-containing protein [bacterium]|nr:DUF134 domain-containing protein [bacterium]
MPRGRRRRTVQGEPGFCRFRPMGMRGNECVMLSVDEFEAIRLKDLEKMDQKDAAGEMDVSQPTFSRIIESAREKVADAIVNGKEIRIEGGEYMVEEKGVPKRDGSGKGVRANRGRGGCSPPEDKGVGRPCGRRGAGRGAGRGRRSD